MEVKIGIQQSPRELVVESAETPEAIEKQLADAISAEGVLTLKDTKGRTVVVPAAKIAYVEIGSSVASTVGFRS